MVSKEEGDSISEDEQPQVEEATSLDRQISSSTNANANDNPTNNDDNTTKPKSKSKKDRATKKAEKKAIKKAQKKAAKRLEKEERKRLKKEERKRLKKEAKKLEKRKLSAAKDTSSSDMDIDNSIDETNSAISTTTDNAEQSPTTSYITTSNTNQNQILQLIPNHIKSNFRTIGFSKWGGNGSNKGKEKGNWLPILELGPFDVEEGPVRDCWFELAEQVRKVCVCGRQDVWFIWLGKVG